MAVPFDHKNEAIEISNNTDCGLAAGLWTRNGSRQMRLAKRIKSAQIFINNYGASGGIEASFEGQTYPVTKENKALRLSTGFRRSKPLRIFIRKGDGLNET